MTPRGRFAPTPSGDLHVGNLRTAVLAWLFAHHGGGTLAVRIDDLDPAARRPEVAERQLADLAALGIVPDSDVVRQSERLDDYHTAIDTLIAAGRTYPCWCSRAEVAAATIAPHGDGLPEGAYPGTCSGLDPAGRARRAEEAGRPPALRLRAEGSELEVPDRILGTIRGRVDDLVVRRSDGVPAYNLAVVVDDAAAGVDEVVRGDDLAPSTPRQVLLARLLGLPEVRYAHVPLVTDLRGERLAKRRGVTTLGGLADLGVSAGRVLFHLARSLDLAEPTATGPDEASAWPTGVADLLDRFDPDAVPRTPWQVDPASWVSASR